MKAFKAILLSFSIIVSFILGAMAFYYFNIGLVYNNFVKQSVTQENQANITQQLIDKGKACEPLEIQNGNTKIIFKNTECDN